MAKQTGVDSGAAPIPSGIGSNAGELEVLRDLIFGNQARDFARRISDLDSRLESVRRELKNESESRSQSIAKTAADQNAALRKEAHGRIDKEVQVLGERLDQLTADFQEHVETLRRAFETRLDRMQEDLTERLRLLEEDARRRDDDLRAELLAVSSWLEDKKTSRHDLGQMLEEIGQRLQAGTATTSGQPGEEE